MFDNMKSFFGNMMALEYLGPFVIILALALAAFFFWLKERMRHNAKITEKPAPKKIPPLVLSNGIALHIPTVFESGFYNLLVERLEQLTSAKPVRGEPFIQQEILQAAVDDLASLMMVNDEILHENLHHALRIATTILEEAGQRRDKSNEQALLLLDPYLPKNRGQSPKLENKTQSAAFAFVTALIFMEAEPGVASNNIAIAHSNEPKRMGYGLAYGRDLIRSGYGHLGRTVFIDLLGEAIARGELAIAAICYSELGRMHRMKGNFNKALFEYKKAHQLLAGAAEHNDDLSYQRRMAHMLERIGEIHFETHHYGEALNSYEAAYAIRCEVVDENNFETQRDVAASHIRMADVLALQGDYDLAHDHYENAKSLVEGLRALQPDNLSWVRCLSIYLNKQGDCYFRQDMTDQALYCYQKALKIRYECLEEVSHDRQWQRDICVAHEKIARLHFVAGAMDEAKGEYRSALAIRRFLVENDDQLGEWHADLAYTLERLAEIAHHSGLLDEAVAHLEEAHEIRRENCTRNKQSHQRRRDLALCLNQLGEVQMLRGDYRAALKRFMQALKLRMGWVARKLDNNDALRLQDCLLSYRRIGEAYKAIGKHNEARKSWLKELHIAEKLSNLYGQTPDWQGDMAQALYNLSTVDHHNQKLYIKGARQILTPLQKEGRLNRKLLMLFEKLRKAEVPA